MKILYNKIKSDECDRYKLLFLVSLGIFVVTVTALVVGLSVYYGGFLRSIDYLRQWVVSDFGQVAYFALNDNPYKSNFKTMYLPINFIFALPFVLIAKNNPKFYYFDKFNSGSDIEYQHLLDYNYYLTATWEFWLAIIIYFAVALFIIGLLLYKLRKWNKKSDFIYSYIAVVLSGIVMYGVFRGTNVFNSLIMILIFMLWKDSRNKWLKELSLVALALAGGIKLYPLIFGVMLLRERRFFDSFRVAIYFAAVAFLPFLMYDHPIATVNLFVRNLFSFAYGESRIGDPMNLSIQSLISWVLNIFGWGNSKFAKYFGTASMVAVFIISVFTALFTKSKFTAFTVATFGLMLIPSVSYYYTVMFFMVSMVLLLDEYKTFGKARLRLYVIMFVLFGFLPFAAARWFLIHTLYVTLLLIYEFVLTANSLYKKKEQKICTIGE